MADLLRFHSLFLPFMVLFVVLFFFSSHKIKLTNQNWEVLTLFGKKKKKEKTQNYIKLSSRILYF